MIPVSTPDQHVIDFGAHIYPEEFLPGSEDNPDADLNDMLGPIQYDPEELLDRMDGGGVDAAVLSQPYYMGYSDAELVADANDALLSIVESEDRFYGLAALPVAAGGEAAAEEFERCLEAGYHGGGLETESGGIELTDDELEPVFDVAEEHDAPLFVHPKLDDSVHPDTLDDTYRLNAVFGREVALSRGIVKAIHTGVLDRHENLDLIFHHLGGNIASMLGRVHLHHDIGRWPGQDAIKPYAEFKAQLEERVYIDSSGFFGYHAPVRTALEELPSSQVLFGTDAPYEGRSDDELNRFATVVTDVASETDAEAVLGGNTLDLLTNVEE
jgi:predicted TIM-barrel fold metal-dependent hydrolase